MTRPPLTEHFTWAEVERSPTAARLGLNNAVPMALWHNVVRTADSMEEVRERLGDRPIMVNSWYRCPALNVAIGGSRTSYHMKGLAVDFEVKGLRNAVAFHRLAMSDLSFDQLIHERTRSGADWIHIGFAEPGKPPRRMVLRAEGNTLGGKMTFTRLAAA